MSNVAILNMMSKAVHTRIAKDKKVVLGNSNRSLKDLTIDMVHASGWSYTYVAHEAFLCPATVKNLCTEKTKWPRNDTLERILQVFDTSLTASYTKINAPLKPKSK